MLWSEHESLNINIPDGHNPYRQRENKDKIRLKSERFKKKFRLGLCPLDSTSRLRRPRFFILWIKFSRSRFVLEFIRWDFFIVPIFPSGFYTNTQISMGRNSRIEVLSRQCPNQVISLTAIQRGSCLSWPGHFLRLLIEFKLNRG